MKNFKVYRSPNQSLRDEQELRIFDFHSTDS
jgi:hypothetical protein